MRALTVPQIKAFLQNSLPSSVLQYTREGETEHQDCINGKRVKMLCDHMILHRMLVVITTLLQL